MDTPTEFAEGVVSKTVVDAGAIACKRELVSISPDKSVGGSNVVRTGGSAIDGNELFERVAEEDGNEPPAAMIIALMVASSEASCC